MFDAFHGGFVNKPTWLSDGPAVRHGWPSAKSYNTIHEITRNN
jgi:hypothetical protein